MHLEGLRLVDRALRGELAPGAGKGGPAAPAGRLGLALVPLAMAYGACMGSFSLWGEAGPEYRQVAASAIKVPLLFALTVLVTFPSLAVFSTLAGSPLRIGPIFRALMIGLAVAIAVLASLGPIVAFFGLSSASHEFLVILNLLSFAAATWMGLHSFLRAWSLAWDRAEDAPPPPAGAEPLEEGDVPAEAPAVARAGRLVRWRASLVVQSWMVIAVAVGVQMAWLLRPLIGSPRHPFAWVSPRDSNAFAEMGLLIQDFFRLLAS